MHIICRKNNSEVAIVNLRGQPLISKSYQQYSRSAKIELFVLSYLHHPNIAHSESIIFGENPAITIYMPIYNQSLDNMLSTISVSQKLNLSVSQKLNLSVSQKVKILLEIASGLEYLHSQNIIHFDLKSDNIMLHNNVVKIIDFGTAEYCKKDMLETTQLKCTITHRAPEAYINNKNRYVLNNKFDIWSFGIVAFEVFSGINMYQYLCNRIDYQGIDNQVEAYVLSVNFGDDMSKVLPENITYCLNYYPQYRPSAKQLLQILNS